MGSHATTVALEEAEGCNLTLPHTLQHLSERSAYSLILYA